MTVGNGKKRKRKKAVKTAENSKKEWCRHMDMERSEKIRRIINAIVLILGIIAMFALKDVR